MADTAGREEGTVCHGDDSSIAKVSQYFEELNRPKLTEVAENICWDQVNLIHPFGGRY
jgi:lantibiotic modifying enzyme